VCTSARHCCPTIVLDYQSSTRWLHITLCDRLSLLAWLSSYVTIDVITVAACWDLSENMSRRHGVFSTTSDTVQPRLKQSTLTADDLSSYWPISNLSFLSKVRVSSHIESQLLFSSRQSATVTDIAMTCSWRDRQLDRLWHHLCADSPRSQCSVRCDRPRYTGRGKVFRTLCNITGRIFYGENFLLRICTSVCLVHHTSTFGLLDPLT